MFRLLLPIAVMLMGSSAHARTMTEFVELSSSIFVDTELDGFTTYAMRVVADTDWTNADIRIDLTSGQLNHVPPTHPLFSAQTAKFNGRGDTATISPIPPFLHRSSPAFYVTTSAFYAGGHVETPTTFQSSWFDVDTDSIGTFDIALITISDDANGKLRFRTISGQLVEEGGYSLGTSPTWTIHNGAVLPVPETSSCYLIILGCLAPSIYGNRRLR